MTNRPEPPSFVVRAIATGLFTGYAPVAPGTVGSFFALCFFLIPGFGRPEILGGSALVALALGIYTSGRLCNGGDKDPSIVVIDEIAGMWIAMLFLPATLPVLCGSFLLFRLFDIIKPFPARSLERLPGGWGIMLDDVAAGIYANIVLQIIVQAVR
ncbi:MAG: phosphatidylglycerophosphatase A [Ignavibacteria bacterium]|nr:phosphatidylglycerophosphatase A [Ignavibacteria bacterium]